MLLLLLSLALPAADELTSGPQVGATMPGQFLTHPVNGPDAGDEICLYCKYGNAPVAMIFAPKLTPELAAFVKALEAAVAKAPEDCGICVIVTDNSAEVRRGLGKLADDAQIKRVVLGAVDADRVKDYTLDPGAGATVLLYSRKVVRENAAFKPGELDAKATARLSALAKKHLGVK